MKNLLRTALIATALTGGMMGAYAANPIVIEAEDYSYAVGIDEVTPGVGSIASGIMIGGTNGAAGNYDETLAGTKGTYATYVINGVPEAGTYDLTIYYNSMQDRWLMVTINNQIGNIVYCDETTESWDGTTVTNDNGTYPGIVSKTIQVYLDKGDNEMRVDAIFGYSEIEGRDIPFLPNLDKFEFNHASTEVAKPKDWNRYEDYFREMEAYDNNSGSSGSEDREGFHGGKSANVGAGGGTLVYNVSVEEAGVYNMTVWYCLWGNRWAKVKVNEGEPYLVQFNSWVDGTEWNYTDSHRNFLIYLNKGENVITVSNYTKTGNNASDNGDTPPMDCFTLDLVNYPDFVAPANEIAAPKHALSDIAEWTSSELDVEKIKDHTEWTIAEASGNSAQVTLEFPFTFLPTGFKWASENTDKNEWTVEASADGQNWSPLTSTGSLSTVGRFCTLTLGNPFETPNPVKFVRLNITGSAKAQIGDFAVFGYPYVSEENHNPEGILTPELAYTPDLEGFYMEETMEDGSIKISDETAGRLFDGDNSTFWTPVNEDNDNWTAKDNLNVEFYLEDYVTVKSYLIAAPYREEWSNRNPKAWAIKAYDDNYIPGEDDDESAAFKVLDEQEDFEWNGIGNAYILPVKNDVESYYFQFTLHNAKGTWHLSQIQLYTEDLTNGGGSSDDTGVEATPITPALVFATVPGGIQFLAEAGTAYNVYSLAGMTVANGKCAVGGNSVALTPGIYVVKIGKITKKVIIR